MRNIIGVILMFSTLSFSQEVDSIRYKSLQEEIKSFHDDLSYYSRWLINNNSPDSIKIQSAKIYYLTGNILNNTINTFGIKNEPYNEYSKNINMAAAMKQVSPILALSYYEPKAILEIRNNLKKLPGYYKYLYHLHEKSYDVTKVNRKRKILKMANRLSTLCQALQENLYLNKL